MASFISPERVAFIAAEVERVKQAQRAPRSFRWVPSSPCLVIACPKPETPAHRGHGWIGGDVALFRRLLGALKARGWWIGKDHRVEREHPILSDYHRQGARGRLRLLAAHYPVGMKFEFYPDPHRENPHGPRYGLHKIEAMDHMTRMALEQARRVLAGELLALGFVDDGAPSLSDPFEIVEWRCRESWHFQGEASIAEPRNTESYNDRSGDGDRLVNGQLRYFRDYDGRVRRGPVFHHINNMWWVVAGGEVRNVASWQLFAAPPGALCGRSFDDKRAIGRLPALLAEAVKAEAFERAVVLRDAIKRCATAASPSGQGGSVPRALEGLVTAQLGGAR